MKKFNFVLDIEAAQNFPSNVDVTYSWGRPDYKYTQYIHRSGVVLAQIMGDGNFLLLANRLCHNRTSAARESERFAKVDQAERGVRMSSAGHGHGVFSDRVTPFQSPLLKAAMTQVASPVMKASSDNAGSGLPSRAAASTAAESIKSDLETFCHNAALLEAFYKEVFEKATPPSATPPNLRSPYATSIVDSNIPALGLPPGVLARDTSPTPMRLSNVSGVGSPDPAQMGRRPSVQMSLSTDGAHQASPRSSVSESDKGS